MSTSSSSSSSPDPSTPPAGPVPAQWAWHHRTLLDLRQRLLAERDEHRQSSTQPVVTESTGFADAVSDKNERDVLLAELNLEENMLAEVEAALQRLHAGTYGLCEATGKTIPAERLRVLPWTRFTREAAEQREKRGPRPGGPLR